MRRAAAFAFASILMLTTAARGDDPQGAEFFESRIRPVLVEHCYECHSAEAGEPKGGLLLDHRAGWETGGDSGPALVPGKPEESVLIDALHFNGLEMPPAGRLPEAVVRDFEEWVRRGAPDPRTDVPQTKAARGIDIEAGRAFWAFQPVRSAPVPAVLDVQWSANWIDNFILARLESEGLRPSVDVDRERLLRRVTFDLIGLPPTPEEIETFLADESPQAWERVVDRLLASPQFGEHWGRHWLDVARYADSNGSDFNATLHNAWRYRTFVIDAFNDDKPYDQFVQEQLAGDLLPYDTEEQRVEQLVATGFLMLGAKMLSERDKLKLQMDVVDEQVDSVGKALLGMTLGCARCHDHKFDPIPTRDYYALAGIFRSTQVLDGEIQQYVSNFVRQPLPIVPDHAAELAKFEQEKSALTQRTKEAKELLKRAEDAAKTEQASALGVIVDDVDARIVGEWKPSTYSTQFLGKGYLHDDNAGKGEKSVTFTPALPRAGIYEVRVSFAAAKGRARNVPVRIVHSGGVREIVLDQEPSPPLANLWKPLGQFPFDEGTAGSLTITTDGTQGHVIVDAAQFIPVEDLDGGKVDTAKPAAQADVERIKGEVAALEAEMKILQAAAPAPAPLALAVREAQDIGDCAVCVRGEPRNPGPVVPRGFLQVASSEAPSQIPPTESGRRELAEWVASPKNPLTARVMVNRIWYHLMGEGLVRTLDNFGVQGERPTHPELLDRLASEFVRNDWSVKSLVRQIALSRAYRMGSQHNDAAWNIDPENRWLWRAHRRRLPVESLRDAMLAVSGRLDMTPGDSPVAGLGTLINNNSAGAQAYEGPTSNRRTLYLPIIRNELPALLTAFDFADPDFVTGQRPSTNVPAQALLLLNSPFVQQAAEQTAQRVLAGNSLDVAQRVESAYRLVLNRRPQSDESARAITFIHDQTNATEQAAWTRLVHALLASTEFRMLD